MYKKYYWLNEDSRIFLSRGYLAEGETPEKRFRDIALNAEKILGISGFADKFEDYLSRGFYSLSTPVICNYGKQSGLPVSCFNSYIPDSMSGIMTKCAEVAIMSKNGGGTSGYFGDIRPRGSEISAGGNSSGPVHFMELFDKVASVVSQGKSRRGSFAAYLDVDHPDIKEFLKIRNDGHPIQEMSFGVNISDKWINDMLEGNQNNREVWALIIRKRFETGYPYINFIDNVNNNGPQVYKDLGMKIKSSNLCVAPETLLLTKDGYVPIEQLENEGVEVWNGECWSKSIVKKTGKNQKLLELTFVEYDFLACDYKKLNCTEYHKFYIGQDYVEKSAKDLEIDDCIIFKDEKGIWHNYYLCFKDFKGRYDDTYCVNEPLEHRVIFNGILTGQCSEIALFQDEENSFVCVLSSLNLLHWDEIKDTDAIETLIYFLDTVNEEFINKTENMKYMESAHNFAKNQRALGMGVLGWHSFLQSKMIPFESILAKGLNNSIFKIIREKADKATEELASFLGEAPLLKGYKRRNVTTQAVAPTTSSSFVLGQVSPSIEPLKDNYFVKDLAKGVFAYKNPFLEKLLIELDKNTPEIWESILNSGGSVQRLNFLSDAQKDVFKTFGEISQKEIIVQAAQRQQYIDQAQSINLFIHPNTPPREVSDLMLFAWREGIKSLYYQRSSGMSKLLNRSVMECKSCEG